MKDSILKKIISLLLSVTLAVGMNGVLVWAEDSASSEDGIAGHADEDAVFTVKVNDGPKEYKQKEDFAQVWKDVQEEGKRAEIHLLKNLDVVDIEFNKDDDDNKHTLFVTAGEITFTMGANVEFCNSGPSYELFNVKGGTLILKGGIISSKGPTLDVLDGNVRIEGGTTLKYEGSGSAINVFGKNLQIGECTIESSTKIPITVNEGQKLNDILANGFAFQKKEGSDWKWVESNDPLELNQSNCYQVKQFPITFDQPPSNGLVTYGDSSPALRAQAKKDSEKLLEDGINDSDKSITYKWQQMKDGKWEDVTDISVNGTDFTPSGTLSAGTHYYRCQAQFDSWFFLNSEKVSITVKKKEVSAKIEDEISKDYDGKRDVTQNSLKLLTVILTGVISSDSVSGSAVSGWYDSEKPGKCNTTVIIKLDGNKKDWDKNYDLLYDSSGNPYLTCSVSGEIIGVSLNDYIQKMSAGTVQELTYDIWLKDSPNPKVLWESSNPDVATVDENGKVTAVSAGSADITVITEDGKYKDSCTVTVSSAGDSSTGNGSSSGGSSGSPSTNVRLPFLKDRPYKRGWGVIQAEAEKAAAESGSGPAYIGIDMNGTVLVPGRIFTAVRNKDVTLAFEMGGGISWSVCGKDITEETVSDTNLSVKAGGGVIPLDVLNRTAGDCAHLELSPAHNGPFGFTAALTIQTGKNENGITVGAGDRAAFAGMYANLYAYNPSLRSLEFVCAEQVGEDGTVHLPVDRASDFTVILSAAPMCGTDTPEDPSGGQNVAEPEPENLPVGSVKLSKTLYTYSGKAKKPAVTAVDTAGRQIPDKYYTVSYQNNIKVGKAAAVVVFKDGYSGTVEKAFTIRPAGTSIKKAAAVSGGFTLKWTKRTAQTSGYQIQYSRTSGFKGSSTNRVNVKKVSVTKKTIKKLKTGKKYYVRIRTYKKVKTGGTNARVYSAWSRAAALRVK